LVDSVFKFILNNFSFLKSKIIIKSSGLELPHSKRGRQNEPWEGVHGCGQATRGHQVTKI
jgi:hypothetical protein